MKKIIGVSFICILIDQIVKIIINTKMELADSVNIINNFFRLTYVENIGAAWSIFSGNRIFLIVVTLIALILIYMILIKNKKLNKLEIVCYGFLIGGILGNLVDRVRLGYVIDYLDFNIGNYNYPIFNLADMFIVISSILIILNLVKEGK